MANIAEGEQENTADVFCLSALNGDASWLLTVGSVRIAIDPWLIGSEIDCCASFNTQQHAAPCASPAAIGPMTAVIITQKFSDHCHEDTLLALEGSFVVFAVPSAIARARACLGYERVRPLDALAQALQGWRATHVAPPFFEPTHGGVLLESPAGSVLIAPHGLRATTLSLLRSRLSSVQRPLTVLATTAYYALPWWLGGTVNLGLANAVAVCSAVQADIFHRSHSEKKIARGCVPNLATTCYATDEQVAAAINCARPAVEGWEKIDVVVIANAVAVSKKLSPLPPQLSQLDAAAEAPVTADALRAAAALLPPVTPDNDSVRVTRSWCTAAHTHTFHTHVFVAGAHSPALLQRCGSLFLDAYGLQRHGWYAQFVGGALTAKGSVDDKTACGWGLFDLGIGSLRAYHTLFTQLQLSETSLAVVLRTVTPTTPPPKAAVQVFLLPPTGDFFNLADGGLHWHHICTVTGVRLLPGVCDGLFMTCLRSSGGDSEERGTYKREGESFIRFIKQAMKEEGEVRLQTAECSERVGS